MNASPDHISFALPTVLVGVPAGGSATDRVPEDPKEGTWGTLPFRAALNQFLELCIASFLRLRLGRSSMRHNRDT
jgi:hypothetical protein